MKKGLLGSTSLIGMTALMVGAAGAAETPTWKLTGNANFQFYYVDQDKQGTFLTTGAVPIGTQVGNAVGLRAYNTAATAQDHGWYFGVDEAELQLNVSGTADNGLNYGFKIEINANTTDDSGVADEARLQLSGGWGTLQMGDEDGAEDIMNYGGENLMGATGGFDGDQDDYLYRAGKYTSFNYPVGTNVVALVGGNIAAPSYPTIAGDTSDRTKVSYFSPRFSGFQVGASITPVVETRSGGPGTDEGDEHVKTDGNFENHYGIGANYDNSFGGVRVRASAVYSAAASNDTKYEDISAWSVGGIVGFGPFSLGANYTDNSDSGQPVDRSGAPGQLPESSYWDVAASFETGPMSFSAGYFVGTTEVPFVGDSTYEHIALTADYNVAPGLGVYAEINMISDEIWPNYPWPEGLTNDTTSLVLGANISF